MHFMTPNIVEDLHCASEFHVPWLGNTIDLVLWGLKVFHGELTDQG
jgi:hypothetical protein